MPETTTTTIFDIPYTPPGTSNPDPIFQKLDIYLPSSSVLPDPSSTNPPLLIFLHGGAWRSNDRSKFRTLGQTFASMGIPTIIPGYRLSTLDDQGIPKVQYPSHVEDAAAAVAFSLTAFEPSVRRKIVGTEGLQDLERSLPDGYKKWKAKRVVLCGHSAGAQMGGMLVLKSGFLRDALGKWGLKTTDVGCVDGFAGVEGIYDIPLMVETWPTYKDWFVEAAFGKKEGGKWVEGSPSLQGFEGEEGRAVNQLVIYSLNDELLDPAQSRQWAEHLKALGVKSMYLEGGEIQGKHDEVLNEKAFFETVARFALN
ncbi:Kynurenine formamidase [Chytridiales sp. JEL 0842]|nr:Kynurenine formamidase [Chytridiales sp. JEL 0842]